MDPPVEPEGDGITIAGWGGKHLVSRPHAAGFSA